MSRHARTPTRHDGRPSWGREVTLAEALVARLRSSGTAVDHLPEEAIFTRPEFRDVGLAFRTKRFPTPELMLTTYRQTFRRTADTAASVIADWNAIGMIEDLPCAQPDRASLTTDTPSASADATVLTRHANDVRIEWGGAATLLVLRLPAEQSVQRAAHQRGRAWIDREIARWPTRLDSTGSLAEIAEHHRAYDRRRGVLVQAYREANWEVVELDASRDKVRVLAQAIEATFSSA